MFRPNLVPRHSSTGLDHVAVTRDQAIPFGTHDWLQLCLEESAPLDQLMSLRAWRHIGVSRFVWCQAIGGSVMQEASGLHQLGRTQRMPNERLT